MPGNKKEPRILEEVQEAAKKAFFGTIVDEVGGVLVNAVAGTIPGMSLMQSSLAAAFGAAGCAIRNGTKRKFRSDHAEEVECGEKEGPDEFQHVYNNDEIVNKRPRVIDNYVSREEREQELDEFFSIPKPVTNFVKRGEFEGLSNNFEKKCSIQVLTSQVSIVGLGGIGKTQLAARFVEKNKGEYKDNFWIDAEKYCIIESFNQLAKKIGISPQDNATCLAHDVYKKLNNQKTLIVFDNVDDYDSVKEFLPHSDYDKINVLITSRYNKWKNTGVHPVELGVFTFEESKELIKKELEIDDDEKAEKLHNKLQGLPLALQQAVAYIKYQRIIKLSFGIEDYLKEYDKSHEEAEKLLDYDLHEKNNDPYMKTVMTTWKVTLDKIEKDTKCGKEAIRILNVMAYFAPDNIRNKMFRKLLDIDRNKVADAIDLLKNYSMVNQGSKSDLSNIHRLVQEVIRIDLKSKEREEEFLSDAIYCLEHGDSSNLGSFMFLVMYVSQYKKLDGSVCSLLEGCGQNFMNEDMWNFQSECSGKQAEERFFKVAKIILKNYIKYSNYKMIKFLLENVQSYYSSRGQSKEWKAMLLDGMESYYGDKKEMVCYLSRSGLELKFDCFKRVEDFPYNFLYSLELRDFFIEQRILSVYDKRDLSEFLKKTKLSVEICQALEIWYEQKVQKLPISNEIFAEGMTQREWYIKYKYGPLQKRVKELISLIENTQPTLRDSGQDETLNSDSEDFEEFTSTELRDARSTPSSAMEVDSVEQSRTCSNQTHSQGP